MNNVALPFQLPHSWKGIHQILYEGVYVSICIKSCIGQEQGVAHFPGALKAQFPRRFVKIGLEYPFEDFTFL